MLYTSANPLVVAGCRVVQVIMYGATFLLPWREPTILKTNEAVVETLHALEVERVLLVTDAALTSLGLAQPLITTLECAHIDVSVYDRTVANPTIDNVEEALALYHATGGQAVIGFGGGSSMDCAKGVAARVARPHKTLLQMKGLFKVLKRTVPTVAVPTTSGTGSEATVAAVLTDARTHVKYPINDISLIPHYALLDEELTLGLPQAVTSTTGMDALTHAIEAFIGHGTTKRTREQSLKATRLVFENLEVAYVDGACRKARACMQHASYLAGCAFTRSYVGNVHAISHALSGLYGVAHGLTNAVALPIVLDYYLDHGKAVASLNRLAQEVGLADARAFVEEIKAMNNRMNIPENLEKMGIKKEDYAFLTKQACAEANPLYPVPLIFSRDDFAHILDELAGANDE